MTDNERMIAFVRARFDEQEARIRDAGRLAWATFRNPDGSMRYTSAVAANGDVWICDGHAVEPDSVQVVFEPEKELADVAAKRVIVDLYAEVADYDTENPEPEFACGRAVGLGEAVRLIAAAWKDHRDYDDAWRAQAE